MKRTITLAVAAGIMAASLIAQQKQAHFSKSELPMGTQLTTYLQILADIPESMDKSVLAQLGLTPNSREADELLEIAERVTRSHPMKDLPADRRVQRKMAQERARVTGELVAAWLQRIEARGGDPSAQLRRMLQNDSWGMNTARQGEPDPDNISLAEEIAELEASFLDGVRAATGGVPSYLESRDREN